MRQLPQGIDAEVDLSPPGRATPGCGRRATTATASNAADRKLIVVKSAQHFHRGFAPLAKGVLWLDGPGALTQDFSRLPYSRVRRPIWPLDPLPA